MGKDYFKITIGKPVLGEEQDIVEVIKKTWLSTYPNKKYKINRKDILSRDFDSAKKINRWSRLIKNNEKSKYLCVAKHENKIVGVCLVSKKKNFNELNVIYILPKYQKMGIGKKMLNKSIGWLGNEKNIFVKAVSYNQNAIDFYENYGFSKMDRQGNISFLLNGKVVPETKLVMKTVK